jgi:C_GCAxxG_C_C family probable redox protein
MNNPTTRRHALKTAGVTLCSAFLGGTAINALGQEKVPPPVAPGESRAGRVEWYKKNGAIGSQALIAAYGDLFGISQETALKIACGFSGGIGLTGEVCGMVTAAIMLIGLKNGPKDMNRGEPYESTVELAKQFTKDYQARHQSVVCRELIKYDISTAEKYAKAHEIEGMWDICGKGLKTCVDLLENKYDILNRKGGNVQ